MSEQISPHHESAAVVARERPELLMFCGAVGLIGNIAPMITIIWAAVVIDHNFIADSISDLARGPHRRIMDVGFYVNAAGLLALAIGTAHAHLGRACWSLGIFALAFLAMVVTLLGLWDEFGATHSGSGMSVHTKLSFLLAPLYLVGPLLMAPAVANLHERLRSVFYISAILWLVFAVGFKIVPTSWDGILEKIAVAATMLWTLPLAWILLVRGYERSHRLSEGDAD